MLQIPLSQDAEKIRQHRSRFVKIRRVPIEILGRRNYWRGLSVRQDPLYGRMAPRSAVGTSSGFDSPAALLDECFEHLVGSVFSSQSWRHRISERPVSLRDYITNEVLSLRRPSQPDTA